MLIYHVDDPFLLPSSVSSLPKDMKDKDMA
jgi:hypothetical protein